MSVYGWVEVASKRLNITHTQVRIIMVNTLEDNYIQVVQLERTTPKRKGTLSRGSDLLPKAITYGCVSTDVRPRGVRFDYMVADAPN